MPTGEVVFLGAVIVDSSYSGFSPSSLTDGDFTTTWASNLAAGGWCGMDLGAAAVVTRFRVAPRPGDTSTSADVSLEYESRAVGGEIQSAADSGFSTSLATFSTLGGFPYAPRYQFAEMPVSGASAARYWRYYNPTASSYGGNLAEIEVLGQPAAGANCRPDRPKLSAWGGRFPGQSSVSCTASSLTTSATFYYTLDGSTPTTASSSTTGAIAVPLTAGAVTTLKVIAYDATCSTATSPVVTAYFAGYGFKPNDDWYDDRGILVEAHGGCILDDTARSGLYYWYGTLMNQATAQNGSGWDLRESHGVQCYSSPDLYNWTHVGQVLDQPSGWLLAVNAQVLYCASNSTYVLWLHGYNVPPGTSDRACVAASSSPGSGWSWQTTSLNPDGLGFKDFSLFADDDGTGYVTYTDGNQDGVYVSRLASNYLSTSGSLSSKLFSGTTAESPTLFKRGSVYFLIYSGQANYYDSGLTYDTSYATASATLGPWTIVGSLFASDPVGGSYNGQTRHVLKLPGKVDGYVWCGDYWTHENLYASRQVWLPLTFPTSSTLAISTPATWDLSTFASAPGSTSATAAVTLGSFLAAASATPGTTATAAVTLGNFLAAATATPSAASPTPTPTPTPSSIPTAFACTIIDASMSVDPSDAIIKDA